MNRLAAATLLMFALLLISIWQSVYLTFEVGRLEAENKMAASDNRHWKGKAFKCDDYIIQEVVEAQEQTMKIANELAICMAGHK